VLEPLSNPIVFYDGVCGLCNRLVQFLLKRDRHDHWRFASLQSEFAAALLKRHGLDSRDLDTVYLVLDYKQSNERVLARSDAIIYLLRQLGGVWSIASLGRVLPKWVRDGIYKIIAGNRYRFFGKYESCLLPQEQHRHKFLDV
jgi:predicted DCC family thiol-disulfide oxidoreductase YuxK